MSSQAERLGAAASRDQAKLGRVGFRAVVGAVLASYLTLELWDVFHYDWLRGYDAWAASLYVHSIQVEHTLPSAATTDVWHNPPLFYAVAALLQPHVAWAGLEPHKAVQLVSVFSGFGVVAFSYLIARELFPHARWIQLGTLVTAAATPVLLRGSLMYHPEPLATMLTAAGLFLAVRAACRGWTLWMGAGAGVLLGFANLTRTWALAVAVAVLAVAAFVWARTRQPTLLRFVAAFAVVFTLFSVPWYVRQGIRYGNPLAFSKPDPSQWPASGRPLSFFTTLDVRDVFTNPYQPTYRNVLIPVVYTDWWGDYSRYFHVPLAEINTPANLPPRYRSPMVVQSVVGVVPSLLALGGAVALAVEAIRRRRTGLALVLSAATLVLAAFVGFLVQYPKQDGDNIKALYLIDIVPVVALCVGWSIDWIRRRFGRLTLTALLGWLTLTAVYDVIFLILR